MKDLKSPGRLRLHRESLRSLTEAELVEVVAAFQKAKPCPTSVSGPGDLRPRSCRGIPLTPTGEGVCI